jgi:hypothetical protein
MSSERRTSVKLSDLQKMSAKEIEQLWYEGAFPFDEASCGACLTQHRFTLTFCTNRSGHAALIKEVAALSMNYRETFEHEHLEKLFAMRIFWADSYKNPVPADAFEETEPTTEPLPLGDLDIALTPKSF